MLCVILAPIVNVDYEMLDTMLTFQPGDTRQCVNITIIDDNIEEGNIPEDFDVQLLPVTGGGLDFDPTNLEIEIVDSDSK